MPKVLGSTPHWLQRPSPGHKLFAPKPTTSRSVGQKERKKSERLPRNIATRDSEVFVAVGNEIRWADLAQWKEDGFATQTFRTLKVSMPLPIERLTISPDGDYLAVSTSHTAHVVLLPDASLLTATEDGPIRPKTFQVGPTAHVLEEPPIASVLWHPLGYHGRCLVTITQGGVVRLWEINRADRSSFAEPALSIDLEKLANATTDEEDLGASQYGAPKGFSPDAADLEVASACFGDYPEQEGVHGWAPMTLWIATVSGSVYALCPLLPSKWQLVESPGVTTFVQTLASSININHVDVTNDVEAPKEDSITADKQVSFLEDILVQEPFREELRHGDTAQIFHRPQSVPAVPLLQGPFSIVPDVDDFELSDMIVYSLKTFSTGTEDQAAEGLPAAVVCLLTDTCQVHICLDLEGIVGKWLPSVEDDVMSEMSEHALIVVETVTLTDDITSSGKQSITPDVHSDFTFFVSHASGVYYISLEKWIGQLEAELSEPQSEGAEFRLKRLLESANTLVERHIRRKSDKIREVGSCVVMEDGNVGYLVLTTADGEPQAVFLDAPEDDLPTDEELAEYMEVISPAGEVREPWQVPGELWTPFDLYGSLNIPHRHKALLREEIRLSPANLEVLMGAHRVLAAHTDKLQHAVSDLFNRCQRLQEEYKDQIVRVAQVMPKVDAVTDSDGATISERLENVKSKHEEQQARYQALQRKFNSIGGNELSEKEVGLAQELQTMESSVDRTRAQGDNSDVPVWQRLEKVKEMKEKLSKEVSQARTASQEERPMTPSFKVPSHSRKQESEHIDQMLQHVTDLTESITKRLRSSGISVATTGA